MSDMTLLRIGILVAGLILIAAILFIGRPRRPGQGKRVLRDDAAAREGRQEPTLGEQLEGGPGASAAEVARQPELEPSPNSNCASAHPTPRPVRAPISAAA
jgi:cell division protein ZipA